MLNAKMSLCYNIMHLTLTCMPCKIYEHISYVKLHNMLLINAYIVPIQIPKIVHQKIALHLYNVADNNSLIITIDIIVQIVIITLVTIGIIVIIIDTLKHLEHNHHLYDRHPYHHR